MDSAYFHLNDASASSWSYLTDPAVGGPWSADHQHGGPPNALLVHVAESIAAAETGRNDLEALRIAAEFVGPVPVAPVTVTGQVVRAARSAVLVDTTLHAAGRECLHARVWLVRRADTSGIAAPAAPVDQPSAGLPGLGANFPYAESIEWRSELGGLNVPGPARVWARPRMAVVDNAVLTSLQFAALVGDSTNGISAELDWNIWSFQNVDLDVHLARPIVGPWLLMDAQTTIGPAGAAMARATLSDAHGALGSTSQTLVVAPRKP